MDYVYKFPVARGVQAKKEYYIAIVPLKMLLCLFPIDDEHVLLEYRVQRKLNESGMLVISKYILDKMLNSCLNKNAVKTYDSISELYDFRDEMAVITRNTQKMRYRKQ